MIVWISGIPAAGKTTLGQALAEELGADLIDSHDLRVARADQDFSREGRRKNVVMLAVEAGLRSSIGGVDVVVACISPYRDDRMVARYIAEAMNEKFFCVWLQCSVHVAEARDMKGLYFMARTGKAKNVTGVDDPYEYGPDFDLEFETDHASVAHCLEKTLAKVRPNGKDR